MKWKSIYLSDTKKLKVALENNHVLIFDEMSGDFVRIPIKDIDLILVDNYKFTITAQLLSELAKNHISLLVSSPKNHTPVSFLANPFANHFKRGKIIENQFLTLQNESKKLEISKKIINAKITNYESIFGKKIPKETIEHTEDLDSLLALEGAFAKKHWKRIRLKRTYRDPQIDIENSFLNYGYAILRSRIASAIAQYGMLPSLSIFHSNHTNPFALADDLIEPFRFTVDYLLLQNRDKVEEKDFLTPEIKKIALSVLRLKIRNAGKRIELSNHIETVCQNLQKTFLDFEYKEKLFRSMIFEIL